MEHLESSIVLVQKISADQRTPLVFHQVPSLDFLVRKHVIKMADEWEVMDEPVDPRILGNSIFFKNRVRIISDVDRLTIQQDMKEKASLNEIAAMAEKIVAKLEDADYAGAGINFLSTFPSDDPGGEINKRFLQQIPQIPSNRVISGTLSYTYMMEDVQVTFNVEAVRRIDEPSSQHSAVSFRSNYHWGNPYRKKIKDFLAKICDFKDDHLSQQKQLFG